MTTIDHSLKFIEFLQTFRRGELLARADEELARVIEAIAENGGTGSVTITLPFKRNKADQLECQPTVKGKVPERPIGLGVYWANEDGRLTRRDPRQMDIEDEIAARRAAE